MRTPHILLTLAALALLAVPAYAEEEMAPEATSEEAAEFDMEAMMAAYTEAATPGPEHEALAALAGEYDVVSKFRMDPEGEWMESPATETIVPMLGGRFIHMQVMGEPSAMMPEGFEGAGLMGYNNADQRYEHIWVDTMGTLVMFMTGTADDDGNITLEGTYTCPYMHVGLNSKWVYKPTDDGYVMEMWMPGMDGELFFGGEITGTRK